MNGASPGALARLFEDALGGYLSPSRFVRLASSSILVAGTGCNVAELLVRKGVGTIVIADAERYRPSDIRHRGSLASTWGRPKAGVIRARLRDVHPRARVRAVREGITSRNVDALTRQADYVVDTLDVRALPAKIALHRAARRHDKTVLWPCPAINGAVLWVFMPEGPGVERFFGIDVRTPPERAALRVLQRVVPHSAPMPDDLRRAVLSGLRALPADAVGVDQASVLAVAAIENLILGRADRIVKVPRGLLIDVSEPGFLARVFPPQGSEC